MAYSDAMKDRIAFAKIDQDTVSALSDYSDDLVKVLPSILEKFYAHVSDWPNLARMFKDKPMSASI